MAEAGDGLALAAPHGHHIEAVKAAALLGAQAIHGDTMSNAVASRRERRMMCIHIVAAPQRNTPRRRRKKAIGKGEAAIKVIIIILI
jgi:hypothetical protein